MMLYKILRRFYCPYRQRTIIRCLFTDDCLGLVAFDKEKERRNFLLPPLKKTELFLNSAENSNKRVFADDVKNALVLSDSVDMLETTVHLALNYAENSDVFSNFLPGPVICRALHRFGDVRLVEKLIFADENNGVAPLFDYLSCYQIVADLLFEKGRYESVLRIWDAYKSSSKLDKKLPYPSVFQILVCASCHKLDTIVSYELALDIISSCLKSGYPLQRKAVNFVVSLALKQNRPSEAYELLSLVLNNEQEEGVEVGQAHHKTVCGRSLSVLILTKLEKIEEAMDILRFLLYVDSPKQMMDDYAIAEESVNALGEKIQSCGNEKIIRNFEQLFAVLVSGKHVVPLTLDELLHTPVQLRRTGTLSGLEDHFLEKFDFGKADFDIMPGKILQ